ncbi:cation:proton antiporter [Altererythrobacter sp. Root672]|uniref:cation:proton antiporter n=1 Tax=Altererythrobacter sp. Root672 TaxID=1736584 RepID=UPI0006FA8121|nr:cation:proton antiporter [Altererythrobacter sp. Root672]KRA81201.1 potassium transporter [Altererythrobacter sp. Root672]
MSLGELSVAFFLQIFVIIAACRAMGWVVKRFFDQPQVIGEMIAGVILGPSLFGLLAPELQQTVFPPDSKPVLYVCAQLGVGLYMFLVGLGFRTDHFRDNAKSAVAVSFSGMFAPFLVAVALTPWLLNLDLFGEGVSGLQATLFIGACISITAFPVLARIIQERGLTKTPLGSLALSAGAIDDAGAWTVLAIVLASFGGGPEVALKAIVGGGLFAAFMILLGPKVFAPLARWAEREGKMTPPLLAVVVMLFGLSAWAMDAAGLHSVFGGFLLGVAMPRGLLTREIKRQMEPFTIALLVPMFFVFSGLNTQLTMVNSLDLAAIAGVILVGSIAAKALACWAAARVTGQDNPTAMAVGALTNARGLMELIIINIGLQRGIIGPALFSMLVVMAIVTTLMASPLFELVYGRKARASGELGQLNDDEDEDEEERGKLELAPSRLR